MQPRALLLTVFLAYVVLDLGCPLVPGAFNFDPAASVDGVSGSRTRPPTLPGPTSLPATPSLRPAIPAMPQGSEVHVASVPVAWRPRTVREHLTAPDPPRAADDD